MSQVRRPGGSLSALRPGVTIREAHHTSRPAPGMTHSLRVSPASDPAPADDYCPVCGRPDEFCVVCGSQHDRSRPHARVPGEEVRFTREDLHAIEREATAWEGSREYEENVQGVRAHTQQLRTLAQKIAVLLTYTG